ncbi:MAG: right-handed parallel beta-helix repeat-containing protein [Chloroflexota bacterium]|nr:right-handed parallel beta-helix repeat-containing protein [Chloroflexota bacterium]
MERGSVREFAEGVFVVGTRVVTLRDLATSGQLHGGIHVLDSRDVVIDRNSARSNVVGIIVQRSAAVLVGRSSLSESEASGIALFEVRHAQVSGNAVTTSRASAGIGVFDRSTQNSIVRNRLWSNAAGVGLNNGASANVVEANTLSRNESGVIVDVGTRDNEVVRNRIEDSGFEGDRRGRKRREPHREKQAREERGARGSRVGSR